jgi:isopenicillin N synthase-like dioxygenase
MRVQVLIDAQSGKGVDGRADAANASAVWRDVAIGEGSFVVNVGEMMNHMTNGR